MVSAAPIIARYSLPLVCKLIKSTSVKLYSSISFIVILVSLGSSLVERLLLDISAALSTLTNLEEL